MKPQALTIRGLTKRFHLHALNKTIQACHDINLSVCEGEFVGITGKSGSGKSTILRMIYRTYLPCEGTIHYHSRRLGKVDLTQLDERRILDLRRHEIGYVSQFLNVVPRTTARQLLEQATIETGTSHTEASQQAQAMLEHFEFDQELWDSYPNTFSGGEKLRLNIARAMIKRPALLLLDEPTASLDHASKLRVRALIETFKQQGTTMLGIFHDYEFMEGLCDHTYQMDHGQMDHYKMNYAPTNPVQMNQA